MMKTTALNSLISKVLGFFHYQLMLLTRNHYPYKLVGEKQVSDASNTIVLYRILGKRDVFEISINELLEDAKALGKFHPTDAVKLGTIALGDVLFKIEDENSRREKFEEIKHKMLNSTRG